MGRARLILQNTECLGFASSRRLGIDSPYEAENVLGGDRVIGAIRATF